MTLADVMGKGSETTPTPAADPTPDSTVQPARPPHRPGYSSPRSQVVNPVDQPTAEENP